MNLLPRQELDRVANVLSKGPYEGYPAPEQRLFSTTAGLVLGKTALWIPDGPWHITGHRNRAGKDPLLLDPEVPSSEHPSVSKELTERWSNEGYILDQYGRPTHPDAQQLLADKRIGLPTGLGFFFKYGANRTIDPVVYRRHEDNPVELLLIKRKIGGLWAFPGGFLDRGDASPEAGARREAGEETHLTEIGGTGEEIVHKRPVGLRDTLHAWTENIVVLLHGDQDYLFDVKPEPGDDADAVGWFTDSDIEELEIFDAHQQYIDDALRRLGSHS